MIIELNEEERISLLVCIEATKSLILSGTRNHKDRKELLKLEDLCNRLMCLDKKEESFFKQLTKTTFDKV